MQLKLGGVGGKGKTQKNTEKRKDQKNLEKKKDQKNTENQKKEKVRLDFYKKSNSVTAEEEFLWRTSLTLEYCNNTLVQVLWFLL